MHFLTLLGLFAVFALASAAPLNTDKSVEDSGDNSELLKTALKFLKNFGDDSSSGEMTDRSGDNRKNQGGTGLLDRLFEESGEKGSPDGENDTTGALLTWLVKLALKSYFQ